MPQINLSRWLKNVRDGLTATVSLSSVVAVIWLYRTRDGKIDRGEKYLQMPLTARIDIPAQRSASAALKCGHQIGRKQIQKHVRGESGSALIVYGQRESGKSWTVTDELMDPHNGMKVPFTAYVKLKNVTTVDQLAAAVEKAFRFRGDSDLSNLIRDYLNMTTSAGRHERRESDRLAQALNFAENVSETIYHKTKRPVVIVFDDLDAIRTPWPQPQAPPTGSGERFGSSETDVLDGEAFQLQSELFKLTTRLAGWARDSHISPIVLCSDQRKAHILFGQKNSNFELLHWDGLTRDDIADALSNHLQQWADASFTGRTEVHLSLRQVSEEVTDHVEKYFGNRPGPIRKLFVALQHDRSKTIESIRAQARNTVEPSRLPFRPSRWIQSKLNNEASESQSLQWQQDLCHYLKNAIVGEYNQTVINTSEMVHACIHRTAAELRRREPNVTPKDLVDQVHGALLQLLTELTPPSTHMSKHVTEPISSAQLNSGVRAAASVAAASAAEASQDAYAESGVAPTATPISPKHRQGYVKHMSVQLHPGSAGEVLRKMLLDACVLEGVDTSSVVSPSPSCVMALQLACDDLQHQTQNERTKTASVPKRIIKAETEARILAETSWRDADREVQAQQAQLDREARAQQAQLDREARAQQAQLDRDERRWDRDERRWDRFMGLMLGAGAILAYVFKK